MTQRRQSNFTKPALCGFQRSQVWRIKDRLAGLTEAAIEEQDMPISLAYALLLKLALRFALNAMFPVIRIK